jgi:AcrR family transcriptional regulator
VYLTVKAVFRCHNGGVAVEKLTPERRRQLTRDALLDAGEDVFVRRGVTGASMEEIAAEAGFSRGAIYSNFGNKDELLLAVMDRFLGRQVAEYSGFSTTDDAVADALAAASVFQRTTSLELVALELELRLSALRNPAVRERLVEADRRMSNTTADLVETMLGDRARLSIPPKDLGDIGRAAIIGLLQYAATDREQTARYQHLVESLFVLLTEAVTRPTTAPPTEAVAKAKR